MNKQSAAPFASDTATRLRTQHLWGTLWHNATHRMHANAPRLSTFSITSYSCSLAVTLTATGPAKPSNPQRGQPESAQAFGAYHAAVRLMGLTMPPYVLAAVLLHTQQQLCIPDRLDTQRHGHHSYTVTVIGLAKAPLCSATLTVMLLQNFGH
jgi:hypothetical protein